MKLKISDTLSLPIEAVTQKLAWLGRTGSGKTYGCGKLAEEMLGAGAQVVVLDAVGVWYGLRSAADGKSPGIAIPVFGGLHGDIPLEATGGALIADLVADKTLSVILDVSQFESDADKARFATGFAEKFFFRKKSTPSAVHLIIEECQEFLPQNTMKGEERMLHAFQRMWKLGRNFGIGGSLISQRPQEVSKKALNQTECLFAFQMTGPHERKAIELWIAEKGLDQDIAGDLPKLRVGQCHVWSPQWLGLSETVNISEKWTFNASSTPGIGQSKRKMELAEIDMAELAERMKATVERAKENDPAELKRRIRELERQVKCAQTEQVKAAGQVKPAHIKEVPMLSPAERRRLDKLIAALQRIYATALIYEAVKDEIPFFKQLLAPKKDFIGGRQITHAQAHTGLGDPKTWPEQSRMVRDEFKVKPRSVREEPPLSDPQREPRIHKWTPEDFLPNGQFGKPVLPKGEHRCLTAAAQYPDGITRQQMTILTGFKRSTRDAYILRLKNKELVLDDGERVFASADGFSALGNDFEPLPTGQSLIEYWRHKLPQGEARIFEVALSAYPNPVTRESLEETTGFKRATRDAYILRMRSRRVIEVVGRGEIRASKEFFE